MYYSTLFSLPFLKALLPIHPFPFLFLVHLLFVYSFCILFQLSVPAFSVLLTCFSISFYFLFYFFTPFTSISFYFFYFFLLPPVLSCLISFTFYSIPSPLTFRSHTSAFYSPFFTFFSNQFRFFLCLNYFFSFSNGVLFLAILILFIVFIVFSFSNN